jgi:hypothetical protein
MIDDSDTSAQHDVLTDSGTSGYARLRGDKRIFAYSYIVCDLDQVVDFDASPNGRLSKGSAVYGGVGADLHVVLHFHNPHLWDFNPLVTLPRVAKSIAPDDHASVQHHSVSHPTPVADNHIRMEHTILSNPNLFSQKYTRIKNGPGSDPSSPTHKDMREYRYTHCQIGGRIDSRFRTNLLTVARRWVKQLQNFGESNIGVRRL